MEHQQSLARYGKVKNIYLYKFILVLKMVLKSMEMVRVAVVYANPLH